MHELGHDYTSNLQPLDQGIIRHVKVIYRKKLLLHVLAHMDDIATVLDISISVNVLSALTWIAQAWDETPSALLMLVSPWKVLMSLLMMPELRTDFPHS